MSQNLQLWTFSVAGDPVISCAAEEWITPRILGRTSRILHIGRGLFSRFVAGKSGDPWCAWDDGEFRDSWGGSSRLPDVLGAI